MAVRLGRLQENAAAVLYASLPKSSWSRWLSAELVVESAGRVSVDFNYDERPVWRMPPTEEAYIDDLRAHPRPADQIPDWYPRG